MPLFNESNRKVLKFFAKFLTCIFFVCGATFSGITAANAACSANQIDVAGDGTNCQDVKFSLTTTDDIANGGVFKFQMGAIGTFYVDCGENGSLATATGVSGKTISRGNTTVVTYTCNYSVGGTKTLRFGGTATGYTSSTKVVSTIAFYISSGGTQDKILSVSGDLSAMFPKINSAATSGAEPRFYLTFYQASNLTSIPETLFSGYTTAVNYMFSSVFSNCNSVTSIPAGLFNRITGGGQVAFDITFSGMKGLTSVPEGLFAGLTSTSSYMFNWTFNGCSNMSGYIPASTFAGLAGQTIGTGIFNSTFRETQILTSCPSDTTQFAKLGTWVSCVPKAPVEITLDTTDADTGAIPSTIYLKHNTGWYSDAEGTTSISSLTTIPTKAGETFTGFYTGQNASGTKIIDENGDIISGNLTFTGTATTLYAHFGTPYTVTYSCGGESGTAPNSDTAFSDAQFTPAANTCSKTGHTFAGWAVSGTNDVKTAGTAFTWNYSENKTLTATWTPNTYTISYTMNGGTNYSGYPTSYTYGTGATINGTPTRTGYTFAGWCTDSGLTTCAMTQTISTTDTGNKTFYAKWTANQYTVTYSCGDGTGTKPADTTATYGSSFTPAANTCSKTEHTFAGWTVSGTSDVKTAGTGFTWNYTQNKTLTAKWTANTYNITLNNIGDLPSGYTQLEYLQSTGTQYINTGFNPNQDTRVVISFKVSGSSNGTHVFYNRETFSGTQYDWGELLNSNIWRSSYGQNIETAPTSNMINKKITIDKNKNISTVYDESDNVLATHTLSSSTFQFTSPMPLFGFNNSGSFTSSDAKSVTIYAAQIYDDGTLVHNFIPAKRNSDNVLGMYDTVNNVFKTNAGSGTFTAGDPVSGANSMTYTYGVGTTIDSTTAGTRDGYTFAGWCTDSALTNCAMTQTIGTTTTGDKTFYAKWTAVAATEYNITYVMDGGTNYNNAPTTYMSGTGATIDGTPTKSGYTFAGWCTDSGLTSCNTTQTISASDTGDKTFYAKWTAVGLCTSDQIDVDGSCVNGKFAVKTTNLNANDTFTFNMTAVGDFTVNCGDGGSLQGTGVSGNTISRTSTSNATYTCTYSTPGIKIIIFDGLATSYTDSYSSSGSYTDARYSAIGFSNNTKVAEFIGDLSKMFPQYGTSRTQCPRFINVCRSCSNLTSISATLFNDYTGGCERMFNTAFYQCNLRMIPSGLFRNISVAAEQLFTHVFNGNSSITSIPEDLFGNLTGAAPYMFNQTFANCTGLTSIPENLFKGVDAPANNMFQQTFNGCTNITGYIPPSTFSGLISKGSPYSNYMWNGTFTNTKLTNSCNGYPGTTEYDTKYRGTYSYSNGKWGDYISCQVDSSIAGGIEYVMNGGVNYSGAPNLYLYGTGATIDGTPTKTDYTFAGWCTDSALTNCAMTQTIGTTATGDKTFYAKWVSGINCDTGYSLNAAGTACEPNSITINWGDGESESCSYGEELTVPATPPTRRGYTFVGWTFE